MPPDAHHDETMDRFLADCLRGDGAVDTGVQGIGPERLAERISYHGLEGLLAENGALAAVLPEVHAVVRRRAAGFALREEVQRSLLAELFDALEDAGIDFLVLKGTALAYLAYDRPAHRQRCDTDIMVPPSQVEAASSVLESLGYLAPTLHAPHYQRPFGLERGGVALEIDLHWRAANSEVVSRQMEFVELANGRQALRALHPAASAPSNARLLGFAIMHLCFERLNRRGHRLIWLEDMRRLGQALSPADWQDFLRWQRAAGMAGASSRALEAAEVMFGRFVPDAVRAELAAAPAGDLSRYFAASEFGRMRRELSIRAPGEAFAYLRDVVLPPPERLAEKYGAAPGWRLPWLYVRRAASGLSKARERSPR